MKILHIAPLWETVPPPAYGGTEAVAHLLVEELVRRGHEITLAAAGDSQTSARLISSFDRSLRTAGVEDETPYLWAHAAHALKHAGDYDLIHNHAGEELMSLAPLVRHVPMLTTTHCNLTPDRKRIWDRYEGFFNTISWAQARTWPEMPRARFMGVSYNGIDVESFPFQSEKGDYLLFLARMTREKGGHIAIEAARRTGKRLVLAGKVDPGHIDYFSAMIAPHIDGNQITYVGEANAAQKRKLFRNASAVLMPIVWDEPFGLVMVEAMACGTPVIAFDRGAASEIVRSGETGFLVSTEDQMVEAVGRVSEIDPARCRQWVASQFGVARMVDSYLSMYRQILSTTAPVKTHDVIIPAAYSRQPAQQAAPGQVA